MISSSTRESGVRDGVLTGPRVPAARLRRDDLITGDPLALAGDLQRAWRLVRAPRGAWIVAEPVARDAGTRRGPCVWNATGPAVTHRVPRGGMFVIPRSEEDIDQTSAPPSSLGVLSDERKW